MDGISPIAELCGYCIFANFVNEYPTCLAQETVKGVGDEVFQNDGLHHVVSRAWTSCLSTHG